MSNRHQNTKQQPTSLLPIHPNCFHIVRRTQHNPSSADGAERVGLYIISAHPRGPQQAQQKHHKELPLLSVDRRLRQRLGTRSDLLPAHTTPTPSPVCPDLLAAYTLSCAGTTQHLATTSLGSRQGHSLLSHDLKEHHSTRCNVPPVSLPPSVDTRCCGIFSLTSKPAHNNAHKSSPARLEPATPRKPLLSYNTTRLGRASPPAFCATT